MNENGPQKVEGMVIIKRKAFWVKRYAKVENQTFSYKKDKNEKVMRAQVDLSKARIKYSNRVASGENFIQLQTADETILMAFESVIEFDKWAIGFQSQQRAAQGGLQQSMLDTSMAVQNNARRGTDDDKQSVMNQSMIRKMRTVALKFSTTFKSEGDTTQAKERQDMTWK
ncbi:hypothetical protein FGO68_gene10306 [Halteria grandinella]|uniref:PH domain-containing protein n=1 Tax=Halteria grandinella TaxID=5974 RepID=A0A8J8NC13_HALGN|nr:hypothetical protein FGO68_gene10306 [Halteria grandinella]